MKVIFWFGAVCLLFSRDHVTARKHATPGEECVLEASERMECGWKRISIAECEGIGCCFNNIVPKAIWCFTSAINVTTTEPTVPTVITEEPTVITEEPTVITEEPTVITEEPTVITEEPTSTTQPSDLPCVCLVEGDPLLQAYDGQLMPIVSEQKTLLSNGHNPDIYDRCRFQVRTQSDDDFPGSEGQVYISWVAFSFGIHPNANKGNERAVQIMQNQVLIRGPGASGGAIPEPPNWQYTTTNNPFGMQPVTVNVQELGNVVTLTSDSCPWQLEFTRGGMDSKIKLSVGSRFKPENNNGQVMHGMCGDCNGLMDDYKLCDDDRTDVSDEEDKFILISDSCAKGEHQHQD